MIHDVVNSKGADAITSDQWHVVHSHFSGASRTRPFTRIVTSEHAARAECRRAAKALRAKLAEENAAAPESERDEVFVRPPNFKTLRSAKRRRAKPA